MHAVHLFLRRFFLQELIGHLKLSFAQCEQNALVLTGLPTLDEALHLVFARWLISMRSLAQRSVVLANCAGLRDVRCNGIVIGMPERHFRFAST